MTRSKEQDAAMVLNDAIQRQETGNILWPESQALKTLAALVREIEADSAKLRQRVEELGAERITFQRDVLLLRHQLKERTDLHRSAVMYMEDKISENKKLLERVAELVEAARSALGAIEGRVKFQPFGEPPVSLLRAVLAKHDKGGK